MYAKVQVIALDDQKHVVHVRSHHASSARSVN